MNLKRSKLKTIAMAGILAFSVTGTALATPGGVHNFKCKGSLYGRTGGYAHD